VELVRCKECRSEIAADCSRANPALPKRTGLRTWLALFLGAATFGTALAAAPGNDPASASKAPTSKAEQQAQVVAALQMSEISWHRGGFNDIMMLNATVQNTGKRDVKDIKVVCDPGSDGGSKVQSNSATIYGPFPAGKSKLIHEFDMGVVHDQAKGTSCSIVDATLATKRRWRRAAP
jgi:hypothetical protein